MIILSQVSTHPDMTLDVARTSNKQTNKSNQAQFRNCKQFARSLQPPMCRVPGVCGNGVCCWRMRRSDGGLVEQGAPRVVPLRALYVALLHPHEAVRTDAAGKRVQLDRLFRTGTGEL